MSDFSRTPEDQQKYDDFKKTCPPDYCPFCNEENVHQTLVRETAHHKIVKNSFPYKNTKSHHLIVPNRHVGNLSDYYLWEMLDWTRIMQHYIRLLDGEEFDVLCRGAGHPELSVRGHVHTHIIVRKKIK